MSQPLMPEKMKLTAEDLYESKIIDKIIKEPKEIDDTEFYKIAVQLRKEIISSVEKLKKLSKDEIVNDRYNKFRNMGEFIQK